ncbi:MAG: ATP-dependent sacrificial sulfur transferase LarE [Deltaproteobacteria bacterium]|jgi:uncharacterized protein|nr:ATP-dependent sacrificial sulfur transferase LarE [Deltaproteobacteria bacterium]
MDITHEKQLKLKGLLASMGSAAVAFSGGVDSTFLLASCKEALPGALVAVTGRSLSFPERELKAATDFARSRGITHLFVDSEELGLPGFADNPPNRCYLCKRELFKKIRDTARERGIERVVEASNLDDEGDYRPGLIAISELGVGSPLREAGLTKAEIRTLSKEMGLPTWDKPSFACLASRFPYGERITPSELKKIDLAEEHLLGLGFRQVRVRVHDGGRLARIECDEEGFGLLSDPSLRESIHRRLGEIGFTFSAFDLLGYRTGSMNKTLPGA